MTLKRAKDLYPILLSDSNLKKAIYEVNSSHKFVHGKPNKVVLWVEETMSERIAELRQIIKDGFVQQPMRTWQHYDHSSAKWRTLSEPVLWPDQYIHHAVIQTLQPVMMRGMDHFCCGSIRGRGTKRGVAAIKHWMDKDPRNTKYGAEADVRHFYDSIKPELVMARMRKLVKDERMMDVIWRLIQNGIKIGAYFSQWFANVMLQPLDHYIREVLKIPHYTRYMDNLTLCSGNKRQLHRAIQAIQAWLRNVGLELKDDWQVFRTAYTRKTEAKRASWTDKQRKLRHPRMVNAMGYLFGRGYTLLRKKTLLRTKRQIARVKRRFDNGLRVAFKSAAGLVSRIGMFKHCCARRIRERYVVPGFLKQLKNVIRAETRRRKGMRQWLLSTALESLRKAIKSVASFGRKATRSMIFRLAFSKRKPLAASM